MDCLSAQPRGRLRKFFKRLRPEEKFLEKHKLNITDASEPTDLKYENLQVRVANGLVFLT
jgi:hypothetical protein